MSSACHNQSRPIRIFYYAVALLLFCARGNIWGVRLKPVSRNAPRCSAKLLSRPTGAKQKNIFLQEKSLQRHCQLELFRMDSVRVQPLSVNNQTVQGWEWWSHPVCLSFFLTKKNNSLFCRDSKRIPRKLNTPLFFTCFTTLARNAQIKIQKISFTKATSCCHSCGSHWESQKAIISV